jgi:hypothetical protein
MGVDERKAMTCAFEQNHHKHHRKLDEQNVHVVPDIIRCEIRCFALNVIRFAFVQQFHFCVPKHSAQTPHHRLGKGSL